MRNDSLIRDHIERAGKRLLAVEVLHREESWADVVRECQEIVELCLKALLRATGMDVPRIHDVSALIQAQESSIGEPARSAIEKLVTASRTLRRDRELAFYGSEDLTPSEFYTRQDADSALEMALFTHRTVKETVEASA
jgi:HEPN domain-containing protein